MGEFQESFEEEQFEEGEVFDTANWEDYCKREEIPMMCSSQSSFGETEGPQHSSNISDFDSYTEDLPGNQTLLAGKSIQLSSGCLQISGNEDLEEEEELEEDKTKSL